MTRLYWQWVHVLAPCWLIHRLCDLCGDEDLCPKCWRKKTEGLTWETTVGPQPHNRP